MKDQLSQYMWCLHIDEDLEQNLSKNIQSLNCQSAYKNPAPAPLYPWEWLQQPRSRVHNSKHIIRVHLWDKYGDAYTKLKDVHIVPSATSQYTIEKTRTMFATLGLPEMLTMDNHKSPLAIRVCNCLN